MMYKCSRRMVVCCLLTAFVALTGCKREAPPKVETDSKAFDSAPAQVKDQWDAVVNGAKTNDYAKVILTCRAMMANPDLSAEQRDAISALQTGTSVKLFDAAQKGDPDATNALQEIRAHWR